MGKTIYQKIIERASGREGLKPGDIVWVNPDLITTTDLNWHHRQNFLNKVGLKEVPHPEKIVAVVDHHTEQLSVPEGALHLKSFRQWAHENEGIHFYDTGRGGLQTQVLVEKGHARPGMLIVGDDPESETCGGIGVYAKTGDQDMWMALATGETWLQVPEVLLYTLNGTFPEGVLSIDLKLKLHGEFGESLGKHIEFRGTTVDEMSIDSRMNLCSCLYLSGTYGIINPDRKTIDYVEKNSADSFEALQSDPDAEYAGVREYDVSNLVPQIAFPPSPCHTKPVGEAEGMEIHEACIGSCANGRIEDLRIAADILKGKKVHPRVRFLITPISQEVQLQAVREGLIQIFIESGAVICMPSCSTCPGHVGRLAKDEVCITTGTVNYPGRMGSKEARIFIASPATVAASAVKGRVTDPRIFFK